MEELEKNILKSPLCFCFWISEHPINAPKTSGDPFKVDVPESVGCKLKMKQGVVHVYKDEEALVNDQALDWPYVDVQTFLSDQNLMYCLMSDGPL